MLKMLATALLMLSCFPAVGQAQSFERRAVVEEFTGTWCGNCPRGMVGLQRLDEQFGERVILIAVHSGDAEPMVIPTYPSLVPAGHGVPSCNLNRKGYLDPYSGGGTRGAFHYGIDVEVAYELEQKAEADVKLTAQWNDAQQWDVRFTATTTFDHNIDDANYRLAFILVEDGLSGSGDNWLQENYFSTASGFADSQNYTDDDMAFWREAAPRVDGMVYNHVAVNTLGIKDGIAGSIKTPITAYSPQVYSNLVTTLNVKVIQDKSRLSAVALLLNTQTGEIVNAAQTAILPYGSDAITSVTRSSQPSGRVHDLQGRTLRGTPTKGLYIINNRKYIKNI